MSGRAEAGMMSSARRFIEGLAIILAFILFVFVDAVRRRVVG